MEFEAGKIDAKNITTVEFDWFKYLGEHIEIGSIYDGIEDKNE